MAFMIWMFIAVCFLLLGVYCFHAKKAVRFWANDEEAIVVNYSAGTLAKHNSHQQEGMTSVYPKDREEEKEAAGESAAGFDPVGCHRSGLLRHLRGGGLDAGQRLRRLEQDL